MHDGFLTGLQIVGQSFTLCLAAISGSRLLNAVRSLALVTVLSCIFKFVLMPLCHGHHHGVRLYRVRNLKHVHIQTLVLILNGKRGKPIC